MRKDTHPGYHPKSKNVAGSKISTVVRPHNCMICRHPEKLEIERKFLEGWRLCDITRSHPWIKHDDYISIHMEIVGLKDEINKKRQIDAEEILERIIRSGLPTLESGKVYPRDMIEAIKALNELKGKEKSGAIWNIIQLYKDKDATSQGTTIIPEGSERDPA